MNKIIEFFKSLFSVEKEEAEPTQSELLHLTLDLGDEIEAKLALFSFNLSRVDFKEEYKKDQKFLDQMVEWNQRANFSQSSILDELKIMSQAQGKVLDGK